jgi:hypothetical protein
LTSTYPIQSGDNALAGTLTCIAEPAVLMTAAALVATLVTEMETQHQGGNQ